MPHQPLKSNERHLHYNHRPHSQEYHHHPQNTPYIDISVQPLRSSIHPNHHLQVSSSSYQLDHHCEVNDHDNEEYPSVSPKNKKQKLIASVSGTSKANQGTILPHQSDEEAAATALLMSAGGPPRNEVEKSESGKNLCHARSDSTDGKSVVEVFHVSPSSNECPLDDDGGVGDHDSIQGELRGKHSTSTIDNFPSKLHELLSSGDFASVAHWMPNGKSWRVVNWHEFSNAMPKYFPKFCKNDRGENVDVMNRMNSFLNEVQIWGFEKERDCAGMVCYYHEFFIKIAPNLCKYVKSGAKKKRNDQILSPPRIGRIPNQHLTSNIDSIFSGDRTTGDSFGGSLAREKDGDKMSVSSSLIGLLTSSPVTPSFILTNHVSPNSPPSRGRLQSNRGRPRKVERVLRDHRAMLSYPISKRGRSTRAGISSRGGRSDGRHSNQIL